jgi:glutathione S-transferase
MKLLATGTSPYSRKVLLLAHETGVIDQITIVPTDLGSEELARENPLNKVPALILDDGTSLFDSPVICEFLDSLHNGTPIFPLAGLARWRALREQALCDGICDAAVLRMAEGRRAKEQQSEEWIARQKRKINQGLGELERTRADAAPKRHLDIGDLAALSALGYLDLRFPADDWRASHPQLAAWFAVTSDRPSFRATKPIVG